MSFLKESNGKWSHKRIISVILIIVGIYMGLMNYDIVYVWTFLGSGLINIGMTVWNSIKTAGHPDPDDDEDDKP